MIEYHRIKLSTISNIYFLSTRFALLTFFPFRAIIDTNTSKKGCSTMQNILRFLSSSYFNKIIGVTLILLVLFGIWVLLKGLLTRKKESLQLASVIGCIAFLLFLCLLIGGYNLIIILIIIWVIRFILGKM